MPAASHNGPSRRPRDRPGRSVDVPELPAALIWVLSACPPWRIIWQNRKAGRWPARAEGGLVFATGTQASSSSLDGNVLLLNAHYMALRVVSVRRAFTLLFKRDEARRPIAEVVGDHFPLD